MQTENLPCSVTDVVCGGPGVSQLLTFFEVLTFFIYCNFDMFNSPVLCDHFCQPLSKIYRVSWEECARLWENVP